MEITKDNFRELFPRVKASIEECDFLAFDTEFSGLHIDSVEEHIDFLDTWEERFFQFQNRPTQFLIFQFGFASFRWNSSHNRYDCDAYNFYIFPPKIEGLHNPVFLCETESIEFLTKSNFDFNKVFYKGIPYLRFDSENHIVDHKLRAPSDGKMDVNITSKEDTKFLESHTTLVENWLAQNSTEKLRVGPLNPFRRRILYQHLQKLYPDLHVESISNKDPLEEKKKANYGSGSKIVEISMSTPEQRMIRQQARETQIKSEIEDLIGFRRVVDVLANAKKPLIGHNLFNELLQFVDQFLFPLQGMAPQEFKQKIHDIFPVLVDTKYFAKTCPALAAQLQSRVLKHIFTSVHKKDSAFSQVTLCDIELKDGSDRYKIDLNHLEDTSQFAFCHEGAFDAIMTGLSFIKMANYVGQLEENSMKSPVLPSAHIIQEYRNKLTLVRSDAIFNLAGADEFRSRHNVFYVHSLPLQDRVRQNNILTEYFCQFGEGGITIKPIGKSGLGHFSQFADHESCVVCVGKMFKELSQQDVIEKSREKYCMTTYSEYRTERQTAQRKAIEVFLHHQKHQHNNNNNSA